ncbi:MAG: HPP family protein [Planctomycetota bacterium]|jgi:CBS-domain-containing membrane protein
MGRTFSNMVNEFRSYWKYFLFQSLLAGFSIFLIVLALGLRQSVIIASLGATAFVVFALPEKITAHPRNVIGGHAVGLICGKAGFLLLQFIPGVGTVEQAAGFGLAVGLAIFVMVILDMEHPPAAGTAFGIVTTGATLPVVFGVMFFAISLSLIRWLLRNYLRDLT